MTIYEKTNVGLTPQWILETVGGLKAPEKPLDVEPKGLRGNPPMTLHLAVMAVDFTGGMETWVNCKIYTAKSGKVTCLIWLYDDPYPGQGEASGYGTHLESRAAANALERLGVTGVKCAGMGKTALLATLYTLAELLLESYGADKPCNLVLLESKP
jgi:hypothetical protein